MGAGLTISGLAAASFGTERLLVRACTVDDAQALAPLMVPDISRWVAAWPPALSAEEARDIIVSNLGLAREGKAFAGVIVERASGRLIGWLKIDLSQSADRCMAELGYWIGMDVQRRGYAFEVSQGAIGFAFGTLGADIVTAGAQVENLASLKLIEKLGMKRDHRRDVWAPARQRLERCEFWLLERPSP